MPHLGEWTQDDDDEENDNDDDDDDKEENDNEESGEKLETHLEQAHRMFDLWSGAIEKRDFDYAIFLAISTIQSR
jgi:fatty acid-binding protein DegV